MEFNYRLVIHKEPETKATEITTTIPISSGHIIVYNNNKYKVTKITHYIGQITEVYAVYHI